MTVTLQEIVNTTNPHNLFIGVVEFEDIMIAGVVDDPLGLDLAGVRLGYPLEFTASFNIDERKIPFSGVTFIEPEIGLQNEDTVAPHRIQIFSGDSPFGRTYLKALKEIAGREPRHMAYKIVFRQQTKQRMPENGPR